MNAPKFAIASKNDCYVFVTGCNSIEKDGLNWAHTDDLSDLDAVKGFDTNEEAEEFNAEFGNVGEVMPFPTASTDEGEAE